MLLSSTARYVDSYTPGAILPDTQYIIDYLPAY